MPRLSRFIVSVTEQRRPRVFHMKIAMVNDVRGTVAVFNDRSNSFHYI